MSVTRGRRKDNSRSVANRDELRKIVLELLAYNRSGDFIQWNGLKNDAKLPVVAQNAPSGVSTPIIAPPFSHGFASRFKDLQCHQWIPLSCHGSRRQARIYDAAQLETHRSKLLYLTVRIVTVPQLRVMHAVDARMNIRPAHELVTAEWFSSQFHQPLFCTTRDACLLE